MELQIDTGGAKGYDKMVFPPPWNFKFDGESAQGQDDIQITTCMELQKGKMISKFPNFKLTLRVQKGKMIYYDIL
jgi:hypothetical protein